MDGAALRERLREVVHPYHLNDWELEDEIEELSRLPEGAREKVLEMAGCIWPVSHALTVFFLRRAGKGVAVLGDAKISVWVGAALDAYEEGGLDDAREVLADGGRALLAFINGEVGLRFQDVASRLLPYACGLAERRLDLEPGERAGTDTATIYLPARINIFRDNDLNFLTYKYTASIQWGMIRGGTYRAQLPHGHPLFEGVKERYARAWQDRGCWLESFFETFPEPALARELFHAAETLRIGALVARELPGLVRDVKPALEQMLSMRADPAAVDTRRGFFESMRRTALGGSPPDLPVDLRNALAPLMKRGAPGRVSLETVCRLYGHVASLMEGQGEHEALVFGGVLMPREAEQARLRRREEIRDLFVEALALHIAQQSPDEDRSGRKEFDRPDSTGMLTRENGVTVAPVPEHEAAGSTKEESRSIRIDARNLEVPPELAPLVREIEEDLGRLPDSYVSGAFAMAGEAKAAPGSPPVEEGPESRAPVRYDEWDFRRSGFRRNWCALHELEMEEDDAAFVSATRRRYRGQLARIRRSFELMRTSERFLRRQREGEDIDIDAVIESLTDVRAGLPSSERLFIRLVRDSRDIAALFLVDMSSSTEGWVNRAIKESLVLLCDALSMIGDRYAVYGFSGMKRGRSEFYHIKHFDEPYNATVKGRLAAIGPRDYTRMGPPIRHATKLLSATEAKVRMLVTLSDGKPEDYDDYRGEYSIEDTRHALIEAKTDGIHPFCITIDREARDYISHMYGEVNYIVIDDVRKLPVRMPEIYRTLTT